MEWDRIADNWAKMAMRLRSDGKDSGPSQQGRPMNAVPNGPLAPTRHHGDTGIRLPATTSVKATGNAHDLTPHR